MDLSAHLQQCHVFSAAQSSSDRLPSGQAAVYAFYEALDFSKGPLVDEIENYVTKHGRNLSMENEDWPFAVKLKFRGNPARFKGDGLKLVKGITAPDVLSQISQQLLFLSVLGEPLYIGKTEDIKVRFVAHHENGFLWKMKDRFQRPPSEFVLLAYYCEPDRARLLESVLIQAVNPAFCEQKS